MPYLYLSYLQMGKQKLEYTLMVRLDVSPWVRTTFPWLALPFWNLQVGDWYLEDPQATQLQPVPSTAHSQDSQLAASFNSGTAAAVLGTARRRTRPGVAEGGVDARL